MPTTHQSVFARLKTYEGKAAMLKTTKALSPIMHDGPYRLTVFNYLDLNEDAQDEFLEGQLLELATEMREKRGSGWSEKSLVPVALVGVHAPLDELDQQCDGVLLLDLAAGEGGDCPVLYCEDAGSRKLYPVGQLSSLDVSEK